MDTIAQKKKIAVLGAGAMGCLFGGRLAQAGNDVTMIDTSPAVVEAGRRWNVPTPCNETLFWLIRALEESFETAPIAVEQGHL